MAWQLPSLTHCALIYDHSNVIESIFQLEMHVVVG